MQDEDRYQYRVAWSEEDQCYVARVAEFPLLAAHGESMPLALDELRGVVRGIISSGEGTPPDPIGSKQASGRTMLRLPRSLHRELITEAKEEGVSLNSLMLMKLSLSVNEQLGRTARHYLAGYKLHLVVHFLEQLGDLLGRKGCNDLDGSSLGLSRQGQEQLLRDYKQFLIEDGHAEEEVQGDSVTGLTDFIVVAMLRQDISRIETKKLWALEGL